LYHRADRLSSNVTKKNEEIKHIKIALQNNGYPINFIDKYLEINTNNENV